ncbi:MAG: SDR family oxidoreductase [Bacteroidota bacterium]
MKEKIFISGATKGIGRAIANLFHDKGWQVILTARGEKGLEEVREALPGVDAIACDMSDKDAVKKLAAYLNDTYGALDVVVNNAGVFQMGNLHEEPDSAYEMMMATNVNSAYYLTKGVLPLMKERKQGSIINICSIASLAAYPGGGSYTVSKFALLGFSKMLRAELLGHGIRVVSVMPGAVMTASWEGVDVPEERLMPAEDIAHAVFAACIMSNRTVVEDIVLRPQSGDL